MWERILVVVVRLLSLSLFARREGVRARAAFDRARSNGAVPLAVQRRRWTALERGSATLQLAEAVRRFRKRGRFPLVVRGTGTAPPEFPAVWPSRGLPFPADSLEGAAMAEGVLGHSLR